MSELMTTLLLLICVVVVAAAVVTVRWSVAHEKKQRIIQFILDDMED